MAGTGGSVGEEGSVGDEAGGVPGVGRGRLLGSNNIIDFPDGVINSKLVIGRVNWPGALGLGFGPFCEI